MKTNSHLIIRIVLLGVLLQLGFSIGLTAMGALFLSEIGARSLPYVYITTPIIMMISVIISSWFLNRWGGFGQLAASLTANVVIGIVFYFGFEYQLIKGTALFVICMLLVNQWLFILYSSFWNYVDLFFDSREARVHYGKLSAGIAAGFSIGSMLASYLSDYLPLHFLFLVWSSIAIFSLMLLKNIGNKGRFTVISTDKVQISFFKKLEKVKSGIFNSPYAISLCATFFLVIILGLFAEFLYLEYFEKIATDLHGEKSGPYLAKTLGKYSAIMSLLGLLFNLFLFSKIVHRLGTTLTAFFLPVIYLVLYGFVSIEMNMFIALGLMFNYQAFQASIDSNNQNLLVKALPSESNKEIRTFIEGFGEPIAVALVGFILLPDLNNLIPFFEFSQISDQNLGLIGVFIALIALIFVFGLHWFYRKAIQSHFKVTSFKEGSKTPLKVDHITKDSSTTQLIRSPSSQHLKGFAKISLYFKELPKSEWSTLLTIIENPNEAIPARKLALKTLGRLMPGMITDQLKSWGPNLLDQCEQNVLASRFETDSCKLIWYKLDTLEHLLFFLEWHAVSGDIADFPLIQLDLFDNNSPNHSYALDSLEYGLDSQKFQRFEPLLNWVLGKNELEIFNPPQQAKTSPDTRMDSLSHLLFHQNLDLFISSLEIRSADKFKFMEFGSHFLVDIQNEKLPPLALLRDIYSESLSNLSEKDNL